MICAQNLQNAGDQPLSDHLVANSRRSTCPYDRPLAVLTAGSHERGTGDERVEAAVGRIHGASSWLNRPLAPWLPASRVA